jgi:hypothetical protein
MGKDYKEPLEPKTGCYRECPRYPKSGLTKTSPNQQIKQLKQVPFPERSTINPIFDAGIVLGAITAKDCAKTSPKSRQFGFKPWTLRCD